MESSDFELILESISKLAHWPRASVQEGAIPYEHIGTSLFLRGWYMYGPWDDDENQKYAGFAKIDLVADRLAICGVRVLNDLGRPDFRFWSSEFSAFLSKTELLWIYRIYEASPDVATEEVYLPNDEWQQPGNADELSADDLKTLLEQNRQSLLEAMRSRLDSDLDKLREKGVRYDRHLSFLRQQDSHKKWKAEYRQISSPYTAETTEVGNAFFEKFSGAGS